MRLVRRHPILFSLLGLLLVAVGTLAVTGIAVWRAAHDDQARFVERADIVLVLGAAQYNGRPSPVFESRLRHAALLYREGFSDRVMVLGGGQPGDVTTEADAGRSWLMDNGIPAGSAFAEPSGNTTLESLRAAADYMRAHDLTSAFLVSDPWHNLRIQRMAGDLGIDAHVSATGASAARTQWTRLAGYVRETAAYLYYRAFHR